MSVIIPLWLIKILTVLAILYTALIVPDPPDWLRQWYGGNTYKMGGFAFLLGAQQYSIPLALVIGIGLFMSMSMYDPIDGETTYR